MLMEDDATQAEMLKQLLERARHQVIVVPNATGAIARLEEERIDLLITDVFVRDGDAFVKDGGISLIGRIRAPINGIRESRAWMIDLPIIAISGGVRRAGGFDPLKQASELGANRTFPKPVSRVDLTEAIDELLVDHV